MRPKLAAASAGLPSTALAGDAALVAGGDVEPEKADDAIDLTPPTTSAPMLSTWTRACVRCS